MSNERLSSVELGKEWRGVHGNRTRVAAVASHWQRKIQTMAGEGRLSTRVPVSSEPVFRAGVAVYTSPSWAQLARGGTLLDRVVRKVGTVSEDALADIFDQIVDAVADMHASGVAHRDLKPEHVMVDDDGTVTGMYQDAALCAPFAVGKRLHSTCGTNLLRAPEIGASAEGYLAAPVDVWSLGVVAFEMFYGQIQLQSSGFSTAAEYARATMASPQCEVQCSTSTRGLILRMLDSSASTRIGIAEIQAHTWRTVSDEELLLELAEEWGAEEDNCTEEEEDISAVECTTAVNLYGVQCNGSDEPMDRSSDIFYLDEPMTEECCLSPNRDTGRHGEFFLDELQLSGKTLGVPGEHERSCELTNMTLYIDFEMFYGQIQLQGSGFSTAAEYARATMASPQLLPSYA